MYKGKQLIGIIPARGRSKGIPGKNIIDLGGYPLIAWTIIRALNSQYLDRLIVSSEDMEIIKIAEKYGCEAPFIRPEKYATDTASSVDVVVHALKKTGFISDDKYFVLLQPTSPFRKTESLDAAIEFTIDNLFTYVMSVSELDISPYHIYSKKDNYIIEPLYNENPSSTRRQDLPKALISNGVLYLMQTTHFIEVNSFRPKEIRGFETSLDESLDIDTFLDLENARNKVKKENLLP